MLALLAAGAFAPQAAKAQQNAAIRLATAPADSYAEPFFGVDGGVFQRNGLDIDLSVLASGGAIAQAMAGNAVDVGIGDVINIAHAVIAGVPLAIIAGCGLYLSSAPTTLLCVAKTSRSNSAKDLEGQTVGVVTLGSISTLGLREWLRQSGANVDAVQLVEMPFPTMLPALDKGSIAAALLSEPFISFSKDSTRVLGKVFDAIAKSFYITVWFARRDWLSSNAGFADRIAKSAYEIARYANGHHAETVPALAKLTKIDPAQIRSMVRVQFATSLDPRQIQPVLDTAVRYGQLSRPITMKELLF
jgi:NitT/TauT family transport system substrate-binding protein